MLCWSDPSISLGEREDVVGGNLCEELVDEVVVSHGDLSIEGLAGSGEIGEGLNAADLEDAEEDLHWNAFMVEEVEHLLFAVKTAS